MITCKPEGFGIKPLIDSLEKYSTYLWLLVLQNTFLYLLEVSGVKEATILTFHRIIAPNSLYLPSPFSFDPHNNPSKKQSHEHPSYNRESQRTKSPAQSGAVTK